MDTATGLLFTIRHALAHLGLPLVLVALALMGLVFLASVVVADALTPATEPIISAPFRWSS